MNLIQEVLKKYPCDDGCSFQCGPTMRTLLGYTPVYDKDGNNINPDRNTSSTPLECVKCHRTFSVVTRYGEETKIFETNIKGK